MRVCALGESLNYFEPSQPPRTHFLRLNTLRRTANSSIHVPHPLVGRKLDVLAGGGYFALVGFSKERCLAWDTRSHNATYIPALNSCGV